MKMLFRQRITFDFRHWEITGDWLGWNCRIMDGSACVAVITKRLWKLTDTWRSMSSTRMTCRER